MSANSFQPNRSSAAASGEERDPFTQDCFGDEGLMTDFFDDRLLTAKTIGLSEDILDVDKEVLLPPVPAAEEEMEKTVAAEPEEIHPVMNSTTLLSDEQDGFILEPVEISAVVQRKRKKKNRILIVDKVKELPSSHMRQQLLDFSDTVTSVDIAPPIRRLMDWKMTGGVDWLMCHPCQPMISAELLLVFTHCLRIHRGVQEEQTKSEAEIEIMRGEKDVMDLPTLEDPSYLQESRLTDVGSCAEETTQIHDQSMRSYTSGNELGDPLCSDASGLAPECLPEEHLETMDDAQDSEERRWNKRTQEMLSNLRRLNQMGKTSFSLLKLCKNNSRKEASAKFYSFLVLKKQSAIELTQNAPYSDIIASPGSGFYSA